MRRDGETTPAFTDAAPVAPPATLQMWTFPGLPPARSPEAGPSGPGDLDESVRATLAGLGYSATLAVRTDQVFESDLRPGDVIVAENVYLDATGEKRTALGRGFFVRSRRVEVPVTATQIIAGALATRDFYPVHHDPAFARAQGNADIVMNILTTNGLLARVVGEWTGAARLRRLVTSLRAPASPGQAFRICGGVESNAGAEVVVSARAEAGSAIHAEAEATVVNPG